MAEPMRPWWSRWWAVALWFLLTLLAVAPAVAGWTFWALISVDTVSGTDMQGDDASGDWTRVLSAVGAVGALALPFLTARWARKAWLGYLLLGMALCVVVLMLGLLIFGIF